MTIRGAGELPLVLIEWEDSVQPVRVWQHLDELGAHGIMRCQSIGFLVYDGNDVKVLAPNVAELDTDDAQASGIIRIPARCVTRVRSLRIGR